MPGLTLWGLRASRAAGGKGTAAPRNATRRRRGRSNRPFGAEGGKTPHVQRIEVRVDNRLRIRLADLPGEVATLLKSDCTHKNPKHFKLKSMRKPTAGEPAKIRTWAEVGGDLTLPRGATGRVRDAFKRAGLEPAWCDRRTDGTGDGRIPALRRELWDHQAEAVRAVIVRQNCIVRAPTGSGKTTAAIAVASELQLPCLVIVWSGNLLDQWAERLELELGLQPSEIGLIRGPHLKIRPITLAMQQTLRKPDLLRAVRDLFGVVQCDELQRFAASTFRETIDAFPARYRVGWSADETRRDRKEFLIYDHFGTVAADIDKRQLVRKGRVLEVEIRVVPTEQRAAWYLKQGRTEGETPDFNRLLEELVRDEDRNELIMRHALEEASEDRRVVILSHRLEQVREIGRLAAEQDHPCGTLIGGDDWADEFAHTVRQLSARKLSLAAGTYLAFGTGIDVPAVERGVAATPIAANRQFLGQVCGRLCRTTKGKQDAALFYLWDQWIFGAEHLSNLVRWCDRVVVWDGDGWQPAREYLKAWKAARKAERST